MAVAIVTTFVVLPLLLLVLDLLRPVPAEPARFAGPPSGKERPVPASTPPSRTATPVAATPVRALDGTVAPAVRAPIGAVRPVPASLGGLPPYVARPEPEPALPPVAAAEPASPESAAPAWEPLPDRSPAQPDGPRPARRAPTGGRRDVFGDGLLGGTVARRRDAA